VLTHERAKVFLLGGRLFKHSAVTCGAAAANSIAADLFFLGVTGIHPVHGLTTGTPTRRP
jgi:DeoR/GlpR family transcriptional regulator of sugar metabolism